MTGKKDHDLDATNRDYLHHDQVDKDQTYHLAEADHGEAFDEAYQIETCDLSRYLDGDARDQKKFVDGLGRALEDIGFAILEGHGVDPQIHAEAESAVVEMFTGPSTKEKMRYRARRHGSVNQGYFPIKETSDIHPDLVEGWVLCRRAFDLGNAPLTLETFWPRPALEPVFRNLCLAHEALILPVMQSLLTYLGCDPHLYDRRLTGTNFGLRLNYYPPVGEDDLSTGAARLLGHEDVDMFTFLPAPRVEGLQVLNRKTMKWVRLDAPPGTIILNTGDYMQRLSNNILPSTTHRVSPPRDPILRARPRVSFPMNVYLWENEMLEVLPGLPAPKYKPIRAIDFHTRITSKYYGDDYAVTSGS